MTLATSLRDALAEEVCAILDSALSVHCMRIDHVEREDALLLCSAINAFAGAATEVQAFVLTHKGDVQNRFEISHEKAVELRNRKRSSLCLVVPTGVADAAASSLANSFAAFDLEGFFERQAQGLLYELSDGTRRVAIEVGAQLRGRARVSAEHWADYLATVFESGDESRAGRELWRVGLIPDLGPDLRGRLHDNARSVAALVRPSTASAAMEERLRVAGVKRGEAWDQLTAFLRNYDLTDSRSWMRALAENEAAESLTFDKWPFEDTVPSDLEAIVLEPFLDRNSAVDVRSGLHQEGGPGSQPFAVVGPKSKVKVRFSVRPSSPRNVVKWRADLVPSRDQYAPEEVVGVELPSATSKTKSCRVPLDIDLDVVPVRAVQVRVVALDAEGRVVRNSDDVVVEGITEEFWLQKGTGPTDPGVVGSTRRETVASLPLGLLKVGMISEADTLDLAPGTWSKERLHYFSSVINGQHVVSIGLSPILRGLEQFRLLRHDDPGRYEGEVDIVETLDLQRISTRPSPALERSELGERLTKARREVFRALESQEHRGLIEVAEWTDDLRRRIRSYVNAYRDALKKAEGDADLLAELVNVDTVRLRLRHSARVEEALLLMPTHPLRLLWYSAYSDLLAEWTHALLHEPRRERRKLLDLDLVSRVAPSNVPALVIDEGSCFLFAQNLRFFWGVALPVGVQDPGRRLADVASVVALEPAEVQLADLAPSRVADELESYLSIHPYTDTLRLNVLNPGSGAFLASALSTFYERMTNPGDGEEDTRIPPRLELVAHMHPPVPTRLGFLADLQKTLYEAPPRPGLSHLAPFFSVALRSIEERADVPGGSVNICLSVDQVAPSVQLSLPTADGDSASFYGLIVRFWPHFEATSEGARWKHRLDLPDGSQRERHPSSASYTTDLVDSYRAHHAAVSELLSGRRSEATAAIVADLSAEDRSVFDRLHHQSDWVVSLDRYLGVEYFDDPREPDLARVSRTYLLDYAPEFLEGVGHRMFVTTTQREEVETVLSKAMEDLGFSLIEESVGEVLGHLKAISGRLALRIVGDEPRAREAVSLGVVAAYLRARGDLSDSILVPVDAHPEVFGVAVRPSYLAGKRSRCDLIRIRFSPGKMRATFIEAKSRSAGALADELLNRIVDQLDSTEAVFRDLFFRSDPPRLDHVLQRSRLAAVLRFYLARAWRHGFISSEERLGELQSYVSRLEFAIPDLVTEKLGFVINLGAQPEPTMSVRGADIKLITASDILEAGLSAEPTAIPLEPVTLPGPTPVEPVTAPGPTPVEPVTAPGPTPVEPVTAPGPIPIEPTMGISVELGMTEIDQEPVVWRPSVRGSPHIFLLGIPGQGKSWTVTRLLRDLARQRLPALVFDFHGQFGASEEGPAHDSNAIYMDASTGLPFSPFEAESNIESAARYWKANAFAVAEIFEYVCGLGYIQRDVVFQAILDCYQAAGFGGGSPERIPTAVDVAARIEELEGERGVRNVMPRVRPLLEFELFPDETLADSAFSQLLTRGLVLDVSRVGLDTVQLAASAFVLRKVYKDMFKWGETDTLRLALVLDEAHRLAKDITLPKIMKEGRKFGVAVVVASQGLADFHPDVIGNAGSKVVFRTNFPMSKKVSGFFRAEKGVDLAQSIEQLGVGEAYVQTPEMDRAARVRMHPLR